jgi:hypothetical protein
VLQDRERAVLIEIERGLSKQDPAFVRSFDELRRRRTADHDRGGERIAAAAGMVLCVVLLIGPRPLTPGDVAARRTAGPPRIAVCTRSRAVRSSP